MRNGESVETMSKRYHELGESELEVLVALWDEGPATVRDILNVLRNRGRHLAYTTVQTFLTRLESKGLAASNKSGLAFVYRARVSRREVTRSRLNSVIKQLFDGAPGPLVLQLMQTERFLPEEIAEFRRLIEHLDSRKKRKLKKKRKTMRTK